MTDYFILFLAWSFYLASHSLLASPFAKEKVNISAQNYRIFYSLVSIAGLVLLIYLMAVTKVKYFYSPSDGVRYVGMVVSSWGVILIMSAFKQISLKTFLGLREDKRNELVTSGIHGRMRHPIYTGTILILTGMFIAVPSVSVLTSTITIFIYLPIGIYLEEKKLIDEFGEAYLEYKRGVSCIIPGFI